MDQAIPELIQVAGFVTLLVTTWRSDKRYTKGVFLWFIVSLSCDVFILNCERPHHVMEVYNLINVALGWGVLYEKYKQIFREVWVFLLSVFM